MTQFLDQLTQDAIPDLIDRLAASKDERYLEQGSGSKLSRVL
jgi:hypothetical protein